MLVYWYNYGTDNCMWYLYVAIRLHLKIFLHYKLHIFLLNFIMVTDEHNIIFVLSPCALLQ